MGRVMNLVLEDEDVLELMRILLETTPKPLWFGLGHTFRARQDTYSKTDRGRTAVILELRARGVAVQQHPRPEQQPLGFTARTNPLTSCRPSGIGGAPHMLLPADPS